MKLAPAPVIKEEIAEPTDSEVLRSVAKVLDHKTLKRDLTKSGDAGLVPQGFYDQIIAKLDENAVVRQFATVVNTASGEDIKFHVTAHSSASLVAEGGQSVKAIQQVHLSLWSFQICYLVQVSSELLADEGVDIESFLAQDSGRALGNGAGADFVGGNGSSKPHGVVDKASAGVTCASATAITTDEVIDLYHSVTSPYRINGAWLMNDATMKVIRQFKDSNKQYLWQPSLQLGTPDNLIGRPIATDPNVETIATAKKVMA